MPILAKEPSLFPNHVLAQALEELAQAAGSPSHDASPRWWAMYTRSRQEKQLMRKLKALNTAFCCPTIERRHRSPSGRIRRVFAPLFANYVFVYGDMESRYSALATNCVSQCQQVGDGLRLTRDLADIQRLIDLGEPLSPESRLQPGDRVRIKTGSFAGFEGTIVQRNNETRLLVAVNFMQKGASVLLDDCQMEYLGSPGTAGDALCETKGAIDVVYHPRTVRHEPSLRNRQT